MTAASEAAMKSQTPKQNNSGWSKKYVNKSAFFYNGGHALVLKALRITMIPKPFQNNFDNKFSSRKRDNQLFFISSYIYMKYITTLPTKQIKYLRNLEMEFHKNLDLLI
jgi:hypothetical protein